MTLEELMDKATLFGRPTIWLSDTIGWAARIDFNTTIKGSSLDVNSARHKTPKEAITVAIQKAEEVVNSFSEIKKLTGKS